MGNLGNNVSVANVYTKISNMDKPFWGLTKNRINQLIAEELDFYIRFNYMDGSITLTSTQVETLLKNKKVASDGDYKINLDDLKRIVNID